MRLAPKLTLPSHTDDVLKARLKTVGVSEYKFQMEAGTEQGTDWRIIDVGGSRSQVRRFHLVSILTFFYPLLLLLPVRPLPFDHRIPLILPIAAGPFSSIHPCVSK